MPLSRTRPSFGSGARQAFTDRERGADWALRQSLVDLASVCELLAGELEPPTAA